MQDLFLGTSAETRDYQVRICSRTVEHLTGPSPVQSVLIDAPTGSGKTVMGLALARHGMSLGKSVGWVAMRRNLLTQAADMSSRFGFGLEGMRMISMFDRDPPSGIDWLFVDEAQHDATATMARIHAVARPERVVGLSATPFRTDRAKLSFDKVVREVSIQDLIDSGHLSEYDHFTVPSLSPESAVGTYLADPEGWGTSVMFFLSMAECRAAESMLRASGVPCELVWSGSDREEQIRGIRDGRVKVAISMSLLAEGLDAEEIRTVFVRPSGRGPTLQMAGRVLRKLDGCGVKRIVQCEDTRYPFPRAARPRSTMVLVGGRFLSLTPNENVETMSRVCLDRLVHSSSTALPEYLARASVRRRRVEDSRSRRGARRGGRTSPSVPSDD